MSLYYEGLICYSFTRDSYVTVLRGTDMALYYAGIILHCITRDSYITVL